MSALWYLENYPRKLWGSLLSLELQTCESPSRWWYRFFWHWQTSSAELYSWHHGQTTNIWHRFKGDNKSTEVPKGASLLFFWVRKDDVWYWPMNLILGTKDRGLQDSQQMQNHGRSRVWFGSMGPCVSSISWCLLQLWASKQVLGIVATNSLRARWTEAQCPSCKQWMETSCAHWVSEWDWVITIA